MILEDFFEKMREKDFQKRFFVFLKKRLDKPILPWYNTNVPQATCSQTSVIAGVAQWQSS